MNVLYSCLYKLYIHNKIIYSKAWHHCFTAHINTNIDQFVENSDTHSHFVLAEYKAILLIFS